MSHTVTIELPASVINVKARGADFPADVSKFPAATLTHIFTRGVQRVINDSIGQEKDQAIALKSAQAKFDELCSGKLSTRGSGGGRTTDPVERELKRLVAERLRRNETKLVAHHGVKNWSEFVASEHYKTYTAKYMSDETMRAEAKRNVEKAAKADATIELL